MVYFSCYTQSCIFSSFFSGNKNVCAVWFIKYNNSQELHFWKGVHSVIIPHRKHYTTKNHKLYLQLPNLEVAAYE